MPHRKPATCDQDRPLKGECYLDEAGLDAIERDCLNLARHCLLFMVDPSRPMRGLDIQNAADRFGPLLSHDMVCAMNDLLGAIHVIRTSPFVFSNPCCATCRTILTENERHIMMALAATRRGQRSAAHAHVMLVCEGNPDVPVHDHLRRIAQCLPLPRTTSATRAPSEKAVRK